MSPKVFSFSRFKEKHVRPKLWMDHDREIEAVREIIRSVQEKGDRALFEYTLLFDGATITDLALTAAEGDAAVDEVPSVLKDSIREALKNIEDYHRRQTPASIWSEGDGIRIGQVYRPLERVGAYVPGGTASYPSSVLMTVVPARVAGVEEIYICTPPAPDGKINPAVIFAAREAGAETIFKVGGVQAVAAMAYGTESIPAVDMIVGPGNIHVTLAKREVAGDVGIDMLAGPSEIMIVADSAARADYIAADMLSQAEHGPCHVPIWSRPARN
ncbi:MAG: histidinol dehydrogenase [Firmicutes bacterium]|nr:histidinol dehydrogenase [Bacillota bacterium]